MHNNESIPADFDFIIGSWRVKHHRLRERLSGCNEWAAFEGTSVTRKILGGQGNLEDNRLLLPEGAYAAVAIRSFDLETRQWAIWWLDGRYPQQLDRPVVGGFADGVGAFYADDTLDGRPIRIRFLWSIQSDGTPRWEQAFSPDGGTSWESNWTMTFTRVG